MNKQETIHASHIRNERGNSLLLTYMVIVTFLGLGAAMLVLATGETKVAERQRLSNVAFNIAEAGLERALYDLRQDFIASSSPSWLDGIDIVGDSTITVGPDTTDYYGVDYASVNIDSTLNRGSYSIEFQNVAGREDVWVKSTGTIGDASHVIEAYVKMVDISPWGNAIFAGAGASGTMINGIVDIRGSVHILGTGLNAGDFAMDMGGTAELVGNNYSTMPASIKALVPALPQVNFNGEMVETLNASLRVKKGLVGLSGSSTVGEPNTLGDADKETVDGVYVTDGWGGTGGAASVYSDNGTSHAYDLGNAMAFPSLSDPYPGYASFQDYLLNNSLVLTNELSSISPTSNFSYSNANGSISMDGAGNLTVSGIVYVDGNNDFTTSKAGADKTITYSGTGSLLVTGNVTISTNLVTSGANSFPTNVLGIMTPNTITMDAAGLDVMGLFYAENEIVVAKQTNIAGSIVSNYFNMGLNVPAIFQVPDTKDNLPPGLIASGTNNWYLLVAWIRS